MTRVHQRLHFCNLSFEVRHHGGLGEFALVPLAQCDYSAGRFELSRIHREARERERNTRTPRVKSVATFEEPVDLTLHTSLFRFRRKRGPRLQQCCS